MNFEDTVAMDEFKARYGLGDGIGEDNAGAMIGPNRKLGEGIPTSTRWGLLVGSGYAAKGSSPAFRSEKGDK